jgi:hypothetical protein
VQTAGEVSIVVRELRLETVVERDGEIYLHDLPFRKGEKVQMTVRPVKAGQAKPPLTARHLLASGLVGMWKDREDIGDSAAYARQLREQAERRGRD